MKLFFQMTMSLLANVVPFSEQSHFPRTYFFTVSTLQSSQFFRVTSSTQQLQIPKSYLLEQQIFQTCHFVAAVIFFRTVTFLEQLLIENRQLFRAATFSEDKLVQNKGTYRRATFSRHVLLYSIKFFRTETFSTKLILQKRYLLRTAIFSKKLLFGNNYFFSERQHSATYFFRRDRFTRLHFLSSATLFIYNLIHFKLVHNIQ